MEQIILLALVAASNILCFLVGAKTSQSAQKGESVTLPNPVQAVQGRRDRKEAEKEQAVIDTIMRNIASYDGTAAGQEDIPGR